MSKYLEKLIKPEKNNSPAFNKYTETVLKLVLTKNMQNLGQMITSIVSPSITSFQEFFKNNSSKFFDTPNKNANLVLLCALNFSTEENVMHLYNENTAFSYSSIIDYLTQCNDLTNLDYTIALSIIKSLSAELVDQHNQKNIENLMNVIFLKLIYNFEKSTSDDFYFFKLYDFMNFLDKLLNESDEITELDFAFVKSIIVATGRFISLKTKNLTINNPQINDKLKKFKVLINKGIEVVVRLYEFNQFYLEAPGMFQHSKPQIFIDQMIKKILDEYNLLVNLSAVNEIDDPKQKKNPERWKGIKNNDYPNAELLRLIHFLELLTTNVESDVLNNYMHSCLQKNFNIHFIQARIFVNYNPKNSELFIYMLRFMFKLNENIEKEKVYGNYIEQFVQSLTLFDLYSEEILQILKSYIDKIFEIIKSSQSNNFIKNSDVSKKSSSSTFFLQSFASLLSEGILSYDFNKLEVSKANNIFTIFIQVLKYFFRKISECEPGLLTYTDKFCVSLTIIWIRLLKNYSMMGIGMIQEINELAALSPYLKSPKQYGLHEFEMNMIIQGTEEDANNMKAIARDHHVMKEQNSETKRLFFNYNFLYYLIFKSKCDDLKNLKSRDYVESFKHPQIIQNALLYLRGDYETQIGDKADKFLNRIKRTFNIIVDYYNHELELLSNFNLQFSLIRQDFVILLQYSVSEDKLLADIARDLINKYIEKYPFIFYSIEIFNTSTVILDVLFRNYNSKFSTISTQLKTSYLNQNIAIPAIKVY